MKRLIVLILALTGVAFGQFTNAKKLQGRPISTTAPANGQALCWDSTAGAWTPSACAGGGATASYTCPVTAAASVNCLHNLNTLADSISCVDSSGCVPGSSCAAAYITNPQRINSQLTHIDFSGSVTMNCYFSGLFPATAVSGTVATPTFSETSPYTGPAPTVTISDATSGATKMYYVGPSVSGVPDTIYTAPVTVGSSGYLRALAAADSKTTSAIATLQVTVSGPPTITLATSCENKEASSPKMDVSCTASPATAAGDLTVACATDGTVTPGNWTVTAGETTMTHFLTNFHSTDANGYVNCWYILSSVGGKTAFTVQSDGSSDAYPSLSVKSFHLSTGTWKYEKAINNASGASGPPATGTNLTPDADGELLVGLLTVAGGVAITSSAPYTSSPNPTSNYGMMTYYIQPTRAAAHPSYTWSTTQGWTAFNMVFGY